jgi:hypothetical protein
MGVSRVPGDHLSQKTLSVEEKAIHGVALSVQIEISSAMPLSTPALASNVL